MNPRSRSSRDNGFQDRRLQPLGHPSAIVLKIIIIGVVCQGEFALNLCAEFLLTHNCPQPIFSSSNHAITSCRGYGAGTRLALRDAVMMSGCICSTTVHGN